jgi:RNA polymerase sigma factor (sigma-70 family)
VCSNPTMPEPVDAPRAQDHLGLVKSIARHLPRMRRLVDLEDLEQVGYLGLQKACERFQPERGVKFSSFARFYIRGAMTDWMRQVKISRRNWDAFPGQEVPLDEQAHAGALVDRRSADETTQWRQAAEQLDAWSAYLDPRDRYIIEWYLIHDKNLAWIAQRLCITESRVSQLYYKAIARVREGEGGMKRGDKHSDEARAKMSEVCRQAALRRWERVRAEKEADGVLFPRRPPDPLQAKKIVDPVIPSKDPPKRNVLISWRNTKVWISEDDMWRLKEAGADIVVEFIRAL